MGVGRRITGCIRGDIGGKNITGIIVKKSKPLTTSEIEYLEDFLLSEDLPEGSLMISDMDGFLTAMAIGPVTMDEEWLASLIFMEDTDEIVHWPSDTEKQRVTQLIIRHYRSIIRNFKEENEGFAPIFITSQTTTIIEDWAVGFHEAVMMCVTEWQPLLDHDTKSELYLPIKLHGTPEGRDILDMTQEAKQIPHDKWVDLLVSSVYEINEFWQDYYNGGVTQSISRKTAKVGRNDPCPCGSNKKYRKCCGNQIVSIQDWKSGKPPHSS